MYTKELRVVIFSIFMMLAACCGVVAKERVGQPGVATRHSLMNFRQVATRSLLSFVPHVKKQTVKPMLPIPHNLPVPADAAVPVFPENQQNLNSVAPGSFAPSPSTTIDFEALLDNDTRIPPDTHGAVGLNDLMVTLNTEVRIQSRTGEVRSTVPLDDFWASVGPFDRGVFDPKVVYDPYNDRWIFTACADAALATSSVLIGVSQTSDPSGDWNLYRIDADDTDAVFADYPSIGFNKKWIVVQMNMFTLAGDAFSGSNIYVFDKEDLYTGGTGLFSLITDDEIGGVQVPAITYDEDLESIYLVQNWDGNYSSYYGLLQIYRISGAVSSPSMYNYGYVYSQSTWGAMGAAGDFAPQLGSDKKIMTNDDRMQNVVYRNGSLWCAHTVFLPANNPTRSSVQWWELTPYGDVVQQGRVDDTKGIQFYAFPSIAVNKAGDAMVGFSRFSANQFASANYAFRFAADPVSTLRNNVVLKRGEAPYYKTYSGTRNRWGDYSNTVVDPINDLDMWTIQEYASSPDGDTDLWGTWWGKLQLTFVISGQILDGDGNAIEGVSMVGLPGTPVTDVDGKYSVEVPLEWSSTIPVKPTKEFYLFSPATRTYAKVAADFADQDYEGVYDDTPPTIIDVSSNNANTWYGINSTINVQVTFSEAVVVTGVPKLQLEMGDVDQWASYASGSGTDTVTFTYKVKAGDTSSDLDYTSSSALNLNGGRIKDPWGNASVLTLPEPGAAGSLGANKTIKVDTTKPSLGTVTPSAGSLTVGTWTTVTSTYLDLDGADNLDACYLLINEAATNPGGAQFLYNQSENKIYMIDGTGVVSSGIAPGAFGVIETENAKIDCGVSTVTQSENTLAVNWRIMLKPAFAKKTCNLYLMAIDDSGASVTWASKGQAYMNSAPTVDAVSPNTGSVKSGNWSVFTCTYSDFDGAADLANCSLLINSSLSNVKGAHFFYDHNQRRFYMKSNAGAAIPTGGVLAGGASMIQSENAVLDCAGTTITASGNTITIAWRVKLGAPMKDRTCNLYMMAKDDVEASTGWISNGQISMLGNSAPGLGAISPNTPALTVGEWKTVTSVYTDVDGYENVATCGLLINNLIASKGAAYFFYDENQNKFFMKNNAGVVIGDRSPGSLTMIESENAILDCSSSFVSRSGNGIAVSWCIMLKTPMAKKSCAFYAQTTDDGAAATGWVNKGQVYINSAPTVGAVSPNSGVSPKEQWVTFTSIYSDIDGAANLAVCELLANSAVTNLQGAHFIYNRTANKFFMMNNSDATLGGIAPGAAGVIESENAALDCAASSVAVVGNTITVSWRVKFKPIISGKTCNLYTKAKDVYDATADWTSKGTIYINSTPEAAIVSAYDSVGVDSWADVLAEYSDLDGAVNLRTIGLLINTTIASKGGAYFFYDENENKLYMKNNAGAIIGGFAPGTEVMIESENAVMDCARTTVFEVGCRIVVNFGIKFKTPMGGKTCNLYMQAVDDSGATAPWASKGTMIITAGQ